MDIIAVFKYLQGEQAFMGAQAVQWNIAQWLRSKAKGRNAVHTIWLVISSLFQLSPSSNPLKTLKHSRPEERTGQVRELSKHLLTVFARHFLSLVAPQGWYSLAHSIRLLLPHRDHLPGSQAAPGVLTAVLLKR